MPQLPPEPVAVGEEPVAQRARGLGAPALAARRRRGLGGGGVLGRGRLDRREAPGGLSFIPGRAARERAREGAGLRLSLIHI